MQINHAFTVPVEIVSAENFAKFAQCEMVTDFSGNKFFSDTKIEFESWENEEDFALRGVRNLDGATVLVDAKYYKPSRFLRKLEKVTVYVTPATEPQAVEKVLQKLQRYEETDEE